MGTIVRTPTRAEGGITPEEKARMGEHAKLWIGRIMRTDPIDHDAITASIKDLYRVSGLKEPRVVIVPSPLVMAIAGGLSAAIWHLRNKTYATYDATVAATRAATRAATIDATRAATDDATINATRAATIDATVAATDDATDAATRAATRDATRAATRDATVAATRAATYDATYDATDDATVAATRDATINATINATIDATNTRWLLSLIYKFLPKEHHALAISCIGRWSNLYQGGNMWGQFDCYLTAARDILGLQLPCHDKYAAWEQCAIHGGFRIMHEDFCMVSDFPATLKKNAQNQPHCSDGPSHEWRDGWKLYHLNGIRCEEWHVMTPPEQLDPKKVLAEQNADIRRELIRRMGIEMLLSHLPHRIMDKKGDYELLSVDIPNLLDDARYLKMLNPSIGVWHLEGVERGGNTVQWALNWRAQQILPANQNWEPSQLT